MADKAMSSFVTTVDEIATWFDQFEIDSIELWIGGAVETGHVIRLLIGARAGAGVRVRLKPKRNKD